MPRALRRALICAAFALSLLPWAGASAAQAGAPSPEPVKQAAGITLPTPDAINKRIEQADALKELEASAKTRLLELYRKTLALVESAQASAQSAEAFRRAVQDAPAETSRIRDALSRPAEPPKPPRPDLPLADLEQQLQKQKADVAALETRLAELQKGVAETTGRPAALRQRLAEAKREAEKAAEDRKAPPPPDETPTMSEARRWLLDAQSAALAAELRMLEDELLSQPARLDLMRAQGDQVARQLEAARIAFLAFE